MLGSSHCPFDISLEFLRAPDREPDSSCIAELPLIAFKTPASVGIALIPFEDEQLGIRSVVPAGWIKFWARHIRRIDPRYRRHHAAGRANRRRAAGPACLCSAVGIAIPQEPDQMIELDGLRWNVYRLSLDNRSAAIAISDDDEGMTLFLMLTSEPEGHEALYRNVFCDHRRNRPPPTPSKTGMTRLLDETVGGWCSARSSSPPESTSGRATTLSASSWSPWRKAFGWSRTAISASLSFTAVGSLASPIIGRLMDRHGARPLLVISLLLMGISFLVRPAMTELWHWYGLSFLQFIGISGITALPAGRLIAIWFPSSQGRIMASPSPESTSAA